MRDHRAKKRHRYKKKTIQRDFFHDTNVLFFVKGNAFFD
jgi:hypothetical protein